MITVSVVIQSVSHELLLDCASLWIFVLLLSWSVELLWLQHDKTSLPTLCPSTSYFFPVLVFKKKILIFELFHIEKIWEPFPSLFFLRAWSGRETSVHSSHHETHKMPNELHLSVELISGNSAKLIFQQQVMVLGEVSTYQTIWNPRTCTIYKTTVVWCFTSSFGK